MSEQFNLDRETNIANHIDAAGKKWEIHKRQGQALFHIRPNPDREDAIIPKQMVGKWTKVSLLIEARDAYLQKNWNESEAQAAKNARTNPVVINTAPLIADAEANATPSRELLIQAAVDEENAALQEA